MKWDLVGQVEHGISTALYQPYFMFYLQMQTKASMYKRAANKQNLLMSEATDNRGN